MMIRRDDIARSKSFIEEACQELRVIISDGGALLIIVFAIVIYTTIYSMAYGSEVVENVKIGVVDDDKSPLSRAIINGLRSGPNTKVCCVIESMDVAEEMFYDHDIYGVVYIPSGFERVVTGGEQGDVGLILDGSHLLLYRQVLEQAVADILELGASIEIRDLISQGDSNVASVVEPVIYDEHILYNPSLGYGSFVMPTILVVIIQQTMLIGIAMVSVRRRSMTKSLPPTTIIQAARSVLAKMTVYTALYAVTLTIVLAVIWSIFGFPYAGSTLDVASLMLIYMGASSALGIALSHLFVRREAPIMMLLWSSVPVLLLAGVSYPREAFPEWLYLLGRLLPSSSAVDSYVAIGSMGASLSDRVNDLLLLILLLVIYTFIAIFTQYYMLKVKNR